MPAFCICKKTCVRWIARRRYLLLLACSLIFCAGFSWPSIQDGGGCLGDPLTLSPTQSGTLTIFSIMDSLVSVSLENGEFWISIVYSGENQSWTCMTNLRRYSSSADGSLERGSPHPTSIKEEPKVSLFDVLTLARLQTSDAILAVYLCNDRERDYWRVLTGSEVYSIDSEKPIVFKREKLIQAPEPNAND